MTTAVKSGLEGVVVAESYICSIDGERGTLSYRGIDIGELAENSTYEETVYLLWYGELPTEAELRAFRARLSEERQVDEIVWQIVESLPGRPLPMEALRTAVSALSCCDPDTNGYSREAHVSKAIRLTTRLPIMVANYMRHLQGEERVEPDPEGC